MRRTGSTAASNGREVTAELRYVSLGAGVESSALLVLAALGLRGCPSVDLAIFADTQDEATWTYGQLVAMQRFAAEHGVTVMSVTRGRLSGDPVIRVPAYVRNTDGEVAPLTQNCTRDYKLTPIRRAVRAEMKRRGVRKAAALIGISLDEADRMSDSRFKFLRHVYPLVDARMRKRDCADLLRAHGLPVPRKSACVFCPWRSDRGWRDLQVHDPLGWEVACLYDDRLREQRGAAVHRSMIPLRELNFAAQTSFLDDSDQFSNDCSGRCGV